MADIIEFSSRRTRLTADDRSVEEQTDYLMKIINDLGEQVQRTCDAVLAFQAEVQAEPKAIKTDA